MKYIIDKQYFDNVVEHQRIKMLQDFYTNSNGDISIDVNFKSYRVNDVEPKFDTSVQAISMFSGAGGLDIGAQLAKVKVLSSLDFFEDSVKTIGLNKCFSESVHMNRDIKTVTAQDYREIIRKNNPEKMIIIGGPPCQPFSKAGYWVTNEKRDSNNDPRNMIVPYFKIISEIMPDGFVLENVESIMHPSNHEAIETIYENMERLGYKCSLIKTNAADYGIPQKRKRVFFLASKKPINAKISPTHGSEKDRLENPRLKPYERVVDWIAKYDQEEYCNYSTIEVEGKYAHELSCVPMGHNYIALSARDGYPEPKFVAGKRYWTSLLKLHPFEPSWTIIASPGHWEGPFHWKNRRLNIKELAAIQTFPEDYEFYGSYRSIHKQIGNAVPPMLGKIIIEELCKWI